MRAVVNMLSVIILTLIFISGCSLFESEEEREAKARSTNPKNFTEIDYYERIQANLLASNWTSAIENLEALEAQFPFGTYAEQAQLELIYAHYKGTDYEAATAAADRFIRLHPRHPNADYAVYIKGLALISESKGFFDHFLPRDATQRDPGSARLAFAIFTDLLSNYPNSAYAADARKQMIFLRNQLARHEIHVANYYFKREAYLAATNRGRYVVENFQRTPAIPDALAVMAQGYYLLDKLELSANAARTLAENFPNHPALNAQGEFQYQDTLTDKSSWWRIFTLGYYTPEKPPYYDSRPKNNQNKPVIASEAGSRIKPNAPGEATGEEPDSDKADRSWLNWLSFGLLG